MADPREYLYFYLLGRRDDELPCELDLSLMAEKVLGGQAIRDVTYTAAVEAKYAAELAGYKRDWLSKNESEIDELGGDHERAYKNYSQGQVDELANSLEEEVLGEVQEQLDDLDISERIANKEDDDTSESDDPDEDDQADAKVV